MKKETTNPNRIHQRMADLDREGRALENRTEQLLMLWVEDDEHRERFDGLFFPWLRWHQETLHLLTSFDEAELRHHPIVQGVCWKELETEWQEELHALIDRLERKIEEVTKERDEELERMMEQN